MKAAARRTPRPRKALLPSGEKLHTRLALIEQAQGRTRKAFVFMPVAKDSKPAQSPEGDGPQRGDVVIYFPPLFDTEAEARMSVDAFVEQACRRADLAPVPVALPWKRTLTAPDPPQRSRDPDPELEAPSEEPRTSDVRPLTDAEMREAMSGLAATGNLLRRHVVRGALTGGELPLGDDESYPLAEFASSTTSTLLIRIWNHRGEQPKPRPATEVDREPRAWRYV